MLSFLKHKPAYEMRISDWSSDVCSSDLHVLIACMPKSGSSFLKEAVRKLTGWPDKALSYAYLQNEQELHLPNMLRLAMEDTVRSVERRVGKECVRTCRSRVSPYHSKKHHKQ